MIKNHNLLALVSTMLSLSVLTGCASIVTSDNIGFPVKSQPAGAKVTVHRLHGNKNITSQIVSCVTPCKLTLRQNHSYLLKMKKNGYHHFSKKIKSEVSAEATAGSTTGNVALGVVTLGIGFLVGESTDAASGADDRLFPGHLNVNLIPNSSAKIVSTTAKTVSATRVTAATSSMSDIK
jgi:hypothetical protein